MKEEVVRVLTLKAGEKHDEQGRACGDDWVLADFGEDMEGAHHYLTTDRVHASEMVELSWLGADELPELVATLLNRWWREGGT